MLEKLREVLGCSTSKELIVNYYLQLLSQENLTVIS